MSARERVLTRLRGGRSAGAVLPQPGRPALAGEDRISAFCTALEAAAATYEALVDADDPVRRVVAYREQAGITGPTAIAPCLANRDWPEHLQVEVGTTDGRALLAVSCAVAGVAETGSLLLRSGPDTPTALNFLPDHQIVWLQRSEVVDHLEDVWAKLGTPLPRAVNIITGPSRTADVEQTIQLGAHGPRRLHVLLLPD